jgi:Peptidase family M28
MNFTTWPASGPLRHRRTAIATPETNRPWLQSLSVLIIIGLLSWLGFAQLRTPAVVPASAPPTSFSAERAMAHLDVIASQSRAVGQPGHAAARDYLVAQLTAMGLQPELQTTTSVLRFEGADSFGTGMVTNVIARIPGTANTGAIAINAHYDGGATGPAAGDNGVGVAATLEVVRAVLAGPALANDLIIVFSDGEENGDLGAAAFNQLHLWAKDVRIAINFEAQGTGGPAMLYATSDDDGWLTGEYLSVAPDPSAYSMLPELVRALPGMRLACDLEDYLLNGAAGLGFVLADGTANYHTAQDKVANIDQGSMQQEGGNTLAAVRHFGTADLSTVPTQPNRVYFTILPSVVVHYSSAWAMPIALLVTVMVGTMIVLGYRRRMLSIGGLGAGSVALIVGTLVTVLLVDLLWFVIKATNADLRVLLVAPYQARTIVLGLSLMAIAIMAAIYVVLQRRIRAENLMAGGMLAWALLMWATVLAAPGASYVLTWPLLFAVLPLGWRILGRRRQLAAELAVLAITLVPVALVMPGVSYQTIPLLHRVEFMMGLTGNIPVLGLWALFLAPLVGLLIPHLNALVGGSTRPYRWLVPGGLAAVALALLVATSLTSGFDAEHPRPDNIAYELDANTGMARFVSLDATLDSYTRQFFPADPTRADYEVQPGTTLRAWSVPTTAVALEGPVVEVLSDRADGGGRVVTFRITSPRLAPELEATITGGGEITSAGINGRDLDLTDYAPARDGEFRFSFVGMTADGVTVTMTMSGNAPISIALTERAYGLPVIPGLTVQQRTAAQMPAPAFPLDATIIRKTVTI